MLASTFILQGYQTLRRPEQVAPAAEPVVQPMAGRLSFLTDDPEQAVRINGAVHLVAGSLLAAGKLPRLSALALAASMVPTTWAGHRFWEAEDEQERTQQKIHFLKNLTMMGGLLIAAADTGAKPSVVWRSRHALHEARHDVSLAARTARTTARATRGPAALAVRTANTTSKARRMPTGVVNKAAKSAGKVSKAPAGMAGKAAKQVGKMQAAMTAGTARTTGKAAKTAGKLGKAPAGLAARAGKKTGRSKGAAADLLARARFDGRSAKAPAWSGRAGKTAVKASTKAGKASTELVARGAETAGRAREMSAVAAARAAQAAEKAARKSADAAGDMRSRLPVG